MLERGDLPMKAFFDVKVTNLKRCILLLVSAIDRVADAITQSRSAGLRFALVRTYAGDLIQGDITKMNLKNDQQFHVTASFTNKQGGPAAIQAGSAVWESTNPGHFTVTPDPNNELSALVKANPQSAGGDEAVGIVRLTVDADTGDGVTPLVAELAVNVIPGDADILSLSAGTPEDQPDETPAPVEENPPA